MILKLYVHHQKSVATIREGKDPWGNQNLVGGKKTDANSTAYYRIKEMLNVHLQL